MSTPIRTQTAFEDGDGGLVIETKQDVSEIVEANKQQLFYDQQRTGGLNELHHVARIPFTVIDVLNQKGIMKGFQIIDDVGFARWLNDPENAAWKTYRGTI